MKSPRSLVLHSVLRFEFGFLALSNSSSISSSLSRLCQKHSLKEGYFSQALVNEMRDRSFFTIELKSFSISSLVDRVVPLSNEEEGLQDLSANWVPSRGLLPVILTVSLRVSLAFCQASSIVLSVGIYEIK